MGSLFFFCAGPGTFARPGISVNWHSAQIFAQMFVQIDG